MPEIVLSAVHRLLDKLDKAIRKLGARKADNVDVANLPDLVEVMREVLGWTNAAFLEFLHQLPKAEVERLAAEQSAGK